MQKNNKDFDNLRWEHFERSSFSKDEIKSIFSQIDPENLNAFFDLKKDADAGSIEAQFAIGLCYEKGERFGQSYSSAAYYYQLAADQGHRGAELFLARLYKNGLGVSQSYDKAFYYFSSAASKNVYTAQLSLGLMYEEGKGIERSVEKAISSYKIAADNGIIFAFYLLGVIYKKIGQKEESKYFYSKYFELLQEQVYNEEDNCNALASLGYCYEGGLGVEESHEKAFYYYSKAAEIELDEEVAWSLARCYEKGKGVEISLTKAVEYYETALSQSNENSLYYDKLGELYLKIYKQEKRNQGALEKAIYYYEKIKDKLDKYGYEDLGEAYEFKGLKAEADYCYHRYFEIIKKQADEGNADALYDLGICYERGYGVERSSSSAFECYQKSAKIDLNEFNADKLAFAYRFGRGTWISKEKAITYYKIAAEKTNQNSWKQYYYAKIGECYLRIDTEESNQKALEYFNKATNNFEALYYLGEAYKKGLLVEQSWEKANGYYEAAIKQYNETTGSASLLCRTYLDLAMFSLEGLGVEKSEEKAYYYYNKATEIEDLNKIKFIISELCNINKLLGSKLSYDVALQHCLVAVGNSSQSKQYRLGIGFFYGQFGSKKLPVEAISYFQSAHAQNDPFSLHMLGECYEYGKGIDQSLEKGFECYKKAAKLGCGLFYRDLARCYENGIGVEQSFEKAIDFYKLAAENDTKLATFYFWKMGKCYQRILKEDSQEKAISYFRLTADADNGLCIYGLYELALVYKEGKGVDHSNIESFRYLNLILEKYELYNEITDETLATIGWPRSSLENNEQKSRKTSFSQQPSLLDPYNEVYRSSTLIEYVIESSKVLLDYYSSGLTYKNDEKSKRHIELATFLVEQKKSTIAPKQLLEQELEVKIKQLSEAENYFVSGLAFEKEGLIPQACHQYTLSAEAGFPKAQYRLGTAYLNGELKLEKSIAQAVHYFELAAQQDDPFGLDMLGECYEFGKGVEKSVEKARSYYLRVAELDLENGLGIFDDRVVNKLGFEVTDTVTTQSRKNFPAEIIAKGFYREGVCYEKGLGVKQSDHNALDRYKSSANNGFAQAQSRLGTAYLRGELGVEKSIKQAIAYYSLAAIQKNSTALNMLGKCYEHGIGVGVSPKAALDYYRRVLELEKYCNSELAKDAAQSIKSIETNKITGSNAYEYDLAYNLGKGYEKNGLYFSKLDFSQYYLDQSNSVICYALAADNGILQAQKRLGEAYWEGELGLEKSLEEASFYYALAASQGDLYSIHKLGKFYERSNKPIEAFACYLAAAELDNKQTDTAYSEDVARCYQDGKGVKKSLEKAIYYYNLSAEFHPARRDFCFVKIGFCYQEMNSKEADKQAVQYFLKAVSSVYAQYELAEAYRQGKGVEQSSSKAFEYYKLIADNQDIKTDHDKIKILALAYEKLSTFYRMGLGCERSKTEAQKYVELLEKLRTCPKILIGKSKKSV